MSLITISGYPCSGKSTRAQQIKSNFEARLAAPDYAGTKFNVVVVDDEGCNVERTSYDDSPSEKPARALVFAAIQRSLGNNNIVIVDGMNYIKGWRYQLYCCAREAKARPATVFVAASPERCREWHDTREGLNRYKQETFDNLIQRFEEPSSMVRWDSPLFSFAATDSEEQLPMDDLWLACTTGGQSKPNAAVAMAPKPPANSVQILTSTTQATVTHILSTLSITPTSSIPLSNSTKHLRLPPNRTPTLSELQRLKRQFETIQKKTLTNGAVAYTEAGIAGVSGRWTEDGVREGFRRFLEESWGTGD